MGIDSDHNINPAPVPVVSSVTSNSGKMFRMEYLEEWGVHEWRIFDKSPGWIGWAAAAMEPTGFKIRDLQVRDNLWKSRSLIRRLLGRPAERLSYRRLGLGSALLQRVISLARERSFTTIVGDITASDVADTPTLIRWYEARGFTFSPLRRDQRLVGTISLKL